jgi:hypothetical protein
MIKHGYQTTLAGRGGEGYLYPTGYQVFTHDGHMTVLTNNDNHQILLWNGVDYIMLEEWQLNIIEKYGVLK